MPDTPGLEQTGNRGQPRQHQDGGLPHQAWLMSVLTRRRPRGKKGEIGGAEYVEACQAGDGDQQAAEPGMNGPELKAATNDLVLGKRAGKGRDPGQRQGAG